MDVREQDEYDSGHIPGAKLLPLSTHPPRQRRNRSSQTRTRLCWSTATAEGRSRKACLLLSKLGYTHICDLGGILDWPYEKE